MNTPLIAVIVVIALIMKGRLEMTMAALLIGYALAIAIVFLASRPISINRPRGKAKE
jgi:ABC-type enterobactin transport system permease subunit